MTRLLAALVLSVPLAAPALAQGLLLQPQPQPAPGQQQHIAAPPTVVSGPLVQLRKTAIRAEIVDGVATTTVEQTFFNRGGRDAEGTWFLPLPRGAVADGFTMTVGGVELAGEVLDAGQARSVYETIVRRKRDPGLLEYAGDGMLRARIYPIPPQQDVVVTVRLRQILEPLGNVFEWQWPLRSTKYGDTDQGALAMDVVIRSQSRISTVVTPHGDADIARKGDREARVTFEGGCAGLDDLRVLYGLSEQEFGLHLLTWRQLADPGYFTMLISPPQKVADAPRRCVQFVVDTSGSMKGDKIEQAKAALGMFLKSLRPRDLFQVVTFSSSVQPFFDGPRRATAENVDAALARVGQLEAKGGTNIAEALRVAFEVDTPAPDDGGDWLGQIVFVTDGQPTVGITQPDQILGLSRKSDRQETRLFALGVGDEIDVRLIDDLVEQHRGARDFVRNKEKIELKVDALCQKISQPALTDVEIRCDGLDSFDVHPARTRDMFCGEMLQVVGRYRDHGMKTVRVRGKQNGVRREFVFEVEFPKLAEEHTFVQTIWARAHVAALLDAIRKNGARQELVEEVRRLATRYGIVTPYTSQLIVEEGMRLGNQRLASTRRDGGIGGAFRGPGDAVPVGRTAGAGMATGGPSGPSGPTPSGPTTPGASGPSTAGPTTGGPGAGGGRGAVGLERLGRARTGKAAVEESLATGSDDFFLGAGRKSDITVATRNEAKKDQRERELVRRAAGRVFVAVGDDLVEQGLPQDWADKAVVIEAFSDDYFALVRSNPKLAEVVALGDRVVFRDGERIVHVKPAAPKADESKRIETPKPAVKKTVEK
ncbi:MAG: VWA domain-containing protein [Planctomycetes bacterium]|nr:VWA domain-containing protein [Planctomycetota bacterium]